MWNSIIDEYDKSDVHLHGRYELTQNITCMCVMSFTKDKYLVTATEHGDVMLWDLDTMEKSEDINIHNGKSINDIKECKTNFRLRGCFITGSSDGSMKIMSLRLNSSHLAEVAHLQCGLKEELIAIVELRNYTVVGASRTKLFFWELDRCEKPVKVKNTHTMPIYRLLTVDDGLFLLSVGKDGKMGVWKGKNKKLLYHSQQLHNDCITDIIKIGDRIITTSLDKTLRIHEIVYLFNNYEWVR